VASGLRQRVVTALAIAGFVIVVLFWMPPVVAVAAVVVVVLGGAWEWAGFAGCTTARQRLGYAFFVGLAVLLAWQLTADPARLAAFLQVVALWWIGAFLWLTLASQRGGRVAATVVGFAVLVPAAIGLGRIALIEPEGRVLLLFVLVLVTATDVGGYFGGRTFGRRKLAPRVSPNKTWEGLVSGLVFAALVALAGAAIFGQRALPWVGICVIVAVVSVVGDLIESKFKRGAGLKDSGTLLPGHGGVLDRIDSHVAAAPIFLLGLQWLGMTA
jgi:phosphatidate cytidylyltransferase